MIRVNPGTDWQGVGHALSVKLNPFIPLAPAARVDPEPPLIIGPIANSPIRRGLLYRTDVCLFLLHSQPVGLLTAKSLLHSSSLAVYRLAPFFTRCGRGAGRRPARAARPGGVGLTWGPPWRQVGLQGFSPGRSGAN